jgi:predicted dienelactone hydrolase
MATLSRRTFLAAVSVIALAVAGCGGGGNEDSAPAPRPSTAAPPLALQGPYSVACSNLAQDFTRLAPGETAEDYWEGLPSAGGTPRYATQLLSDSTNTLAVTVSVPNDGNLFGSAAGQRVLYVLIVCYPTSADNPRSDFALPSGDVVPHMQTGADPPIFADAATRYPVILFSHGYGGGPLSYDHIPALSILASHGYVVVAPFHGDSRFSIPKIEDFSDAAQVLPHFDTFLAFQALRPLAMSAALDLVLSHPQWRDHVDATQIGGFGASFGGETMMLLAGAALTTSSALSSTQVTVDPRLKAAVGYEPYFGQPFLPAFGRDQHGLDAVTLPFLAISGTADPMAPLVMTQQGVSHLAGTRELVALAGVKHGIDVPSYPDIFTWSLTFLDAEVRGNAAARTQLSTMASVSGNSDDSVVIPYNGPVSP